MSYLEEMRREPYRFDFFDAMRRIERTLGRAEPLQTYPLTATPDEILTGAGTTASRPRIGDSASRRDETVRAGAIDYLVSLGQEPHLEFPASNLARVEADRETLPRRIRILSKFLGLLGPEGALPSATTEETYRYMLERDDAFARFLDLFNERFLQLFFRAWADARPIVQRDRPEHDRFEPYILSAVGVGSPPFARNAHVPAGIGLYAGLLAAKAKSASRLRYAIKGLFGVEAEIDEFVGTWLPIDESERSSLGGRNSGVGTDLMIGTTSFSVQDRFRIRIFVADLDEYARFLPEGDACEKLVDLVFFYVGDEFQWDVELALPAPKARAVTLRGGMALGWTSWMAPNYPANTYRRDARFSPAERVAQRRSKA